jgi:predicted transport protein
LVDCRQFRGLNKFVREQVTWIAEQIEARTDALAQRAVRVWPALSASQPLINAANRREMGELAARRDVNKVEMSAEARALIDKLRAQVLAVGSDVLELAEPKSISYHGPNFFLEVLPRLYSLTLLLVLDFNEIDDPTGRAQDATQREFFINARYEGGVSLRVVAVDGIERDTSRSASACGFVGVAVIGLRYPRCSDLRAMANADCQGAKPDPRGCLHAVNITP